MPFRRNLGMLVLRVPLEQQHQLLVALSAAMQLTALSIIGLYAQGEVDSIPEVTSATVASSGAVHKAEDIDSSSTEDSHHLLWGQHLQVLRRLHRLELLQPYGLRAADVLTALSALTHLRLRVEYDVDEGTLGVFQQRMPGLANCSQGHHGIRVWSHPL